MASAGRPDGWAVQRVRAINLKIPPFGPGTTLAISNTATSFPDPLYDFRIRPRRAGYFRDPETGNDYAVNRYESPGTGRFLTPDRMSGHPANPGSWNKYAYVGGDPVNRVDPRGATWFCAGYLDDGGYCYEDGNDNSISQLCADNGGACQQMGDCAIAASIGYYLPDCFQQSGGGGENAQQTQPKVFVPPPQTPMSDEEEQAIFTAGLAEADYLLSKPSCASLFGPDVNPISVLNTLASGTQLNPSQYGFIQWSLLATAPDAYAVEQNFPAAGYAVVLLNAATDGPIADAWSEPGGNIAMAITLIHELGHVVYDTMGGASQILPDGKDGPPGQESLNNANILQNCMPAGGPPMNLQ